MLINHTAYGLQSLYNRQANEQYSTAAARYSHNTQIHMYVHIENNTLSQ